MTRAAIINGIVASLIAIGGLIAYSISDNAGSMFELFFCLSWITLLVGYIPMFLAFLKLRKTDPKAERPYRMPGSNFFVKFMTYLAFILLVAGVIFTIFGDFTAEYISSNVPLLIGVALSFILEEIFVSRIKTKKTK